MHVRAFVTGLAFAGALFASPWIPFVCAVVLAARWRAWEIIVLGVCVDLLYLPLSQTVLGFPFPATIIALALLWGFEPFRRRLITE